MRSLARRSFLTLCALAALGLAACGSEGPALYITSWSTPFSSIKPGSRAPFTVKLSHAPLEKTYIDMEISGGDQQYVATDPADYLVFGAGEDSKNLYIITKNVPSLVNVTINFTIRGGAKDSGRPFSFAIEP